MHRPKVLLTDIIDKKGIRMLEKVADVLVAPSPSEEVLLKEARDVDAIIVRTPAKITRKIIENAKRLKVISRYGVGYDNIDVPSATRNKIPVTYTPGVNALSVAEYTVSLMMVLAKQIVITDKALRAHKWELRHKYTGFELNGKTLGIIGLGSIGQEVARLSKAIGMYVLYRDIVRKKEDEEKLGIEYVPLKDEDKRRGLRVPERLLKKADFISIHVALTDQTFGMIGRKEIASMKKGAFLINTARGGIVDEQALYEAFKKGKLGGAGLDVFQEEPPYESVLLKLENVIATPHMAALTKEALERMAVTVAEDVIRVLKGFHPINIANPEVLESTSLK